MSKPRRDFGAFELHDKIGAGGMASVYVAMQKSLDRKVVLKVLHPHLAEDEKLVQRFEREARAAAMLRHPNIVQVIDCGRFEDVAYIAMEFVEGMDMQKWLKAHGAPPLEVALLMLHDVCSGLEQAHLNRIVHRDIKPANLMMTPEGLVKIMDFGLARRGEDTTSVTVVGSVLGTPAYMSPEQASGEAADERSDIFSLGVVGFELLGGQRPFPGDSYSTVMRQILTVEPPVLGDTNPLVPDEASHIIHRMLQKDVSKRYATIGHVRHELEVVMEMVGVPRGRDLLREYIDQPEAVGERLRKKRLSRHLDQGLYFENLGLGKIDDALREFRRVLFLDPQNKVAHEHRKKLERDREKMIAERGVDATIVMPAGMAATGAPPPPPPRATAAAGTAPRPGPAASAPGRPAPARQAPSRPMLAIAGGALLVVLIAIGALLGFGRKPPDAEVRTPAPVVAPPANATAPDAPGGSAAGGTAGSAAGGAGALQIVTEPGGARVIVDGAVHARRSNLVLGGIDPGEHVVRVERNGYLPQERKLMVATGDTAVMRVKLDAAPGALGTVVLRVRPFASIFVDGKSVGQADVMTHTLQLRPGVHDIRAVHPRFAPKTWNDIPVEALATRTLEYDFMGQMGTLRVSTPGAWGYVWIDGVDTQRPTPFENKSMKPGHYSVTVVRRGFSAEGGVRSVTVHEGKVTTAEFNLKPSATP